MKGQEYNEGEGGGIRLLPRCDSDCHDRRNLGRTVGAVSSVAFFPRAYAWRE